MATFESFDMDESPGIDVKLSDVKELLGTCTGSEKSGSEDLTDARKAIDYVIADADQGISRGRQLTWRVRLRQTLATD